MDNLLIFFLFVFMLSFINHCYKLLSEKIDELKHEKSARSLDEIIIEEEFVNDSTI